ncbi:hypothetical protein DPMN_151286 [Dreissena polymorpha]|uniref:Uncharacterized protein n=1 Tax=Dreissena polymorpha TaxID=45954 RepID=A0A9D4FJM6_DREPO|nr:hypothetical protein DPMN_151286 [Dreissena polymorpha]
MQYAAGVVPAQSCQDMHNEQDTQEIPRDLSVSGDKEIARSHVFSSIDTYILKSATKLPRDAQVVDLVIR